MRQEVASSTAMLVGCDARMRRCCMEFYPMAWNDVPGKDHKSPNQWTAQDFGLRDPALDRNILRGEELSKLPQTSFGSLSVCYMADAVRKDAIGKFQPKWGSKCLSGSRPKEFQCTRRGFGLTEVARSDGHWRFMSRRTVHFILRVI